MTFGGERSQGWLPAPHWGVLHQSAYTITVWLRFSCCVDVAIPCNKRAHSVVLMWWLMDLEVLHMHGTISHEYHGRLCLISISAGMLKKSRRKNKQSWEKLWPREGYLGEWTTPALQLMLYGCLLPLRTDLELTLLRPLNKLQQPLELFCRHLNKRKEDGWKKYFSLKKNNRKGVGKGTLFNIQKTSLECKMRSHAEGNLKCE